MAVSVLLALELTLWRLNGRAGSLILMSQSFLLWNLLSDAWRDDLPQGDIQVSVLLALELTLWQNRRLSKSERSWHVSVLLALELTLWQIVEYTNGTYIGVSVLLALELTLWLLSKKQADTICRVSVLLALELTLWLPLKSNDLILVARSQSFLLWNLLSDIVLLIE